MTNDMRNRLVKLLCNVYCNGEENFGNCPERRHGNCRSIQKLEMCQIGTLADHLLANGVILPPCEVGDTVYTIFEGEIRELKVISYSCLVSETISQMTVHSTNYRGAVLSFECRDLGKTVFLTREDAAKALKERESK